MKKEEFEEFEEFEDGEDDNEDDNGTTIPNVDDEEEEEEEEVVEAKPIKKQVKIVKPVEKTNSKSEPEIQYVGVPRVISIEEMMNRCFDDIQELKQMVNALLIKDEK